MRERGDPAKRAHVASAALTRFVIDCESLLGIAAGQIEVAAGHNLVAPTLVRSHTRRSYRS